MGSTGRNDRRGPWSYHGEPTGSNSYTSISSGTVSTGDTTSANSRLSWMSMEAARHFQEMEMEEAAMDLKFVQSPEETAREKKMKQIKILAKEFFGGPSAAKISAEGGDLSVLERWFRELDVGWVLHIADGTPSGELEHALDASGWIRALTEMTHTLRLTLGLRWGRLCSAEVEEPATDSDKEQNMAEQLQIASFTQQAILKMLTSVDFIVAPNLTCGIDWSLPRVYEALSKALFVWEALSDFFSDIQLSLFSLRMRIIQLPLDSLSSAEVETILDEIVDVLSPKVGKMREAIWSTLKEIRTRILESPEDGQGSSHTQTPQASSDIDEATKSVMMCVMFLENYHSVMEPIISIAARLGEYIPRHGDIPALTSLEVEMVSCLEEKLANKSEAFPDQGLRFLFLLNNTSFMANQVPYTMMEDLFDKVEGYMERYIQVSWAPVLSCLINPTPSCLGKNYSPLPKFESEFQKMYTTQKLWKVPDPNLRNRLRRAIIDEVIPVYTSYLADESRNANLEEMLQELFEG